MRQLIRIFILFILFGTTLTCKKENQQPIIQSNTASPQSIKTGETTQLTCVATDPDGDQLTFSWSSSKGTFPNGTIGESVPWVAPEEPGNYMISIIVNDGQNIAEGAVNITVEENPQLSVFPTSIDFGSEETEKIIEIRNSGTGILTWTTSTNLSWLNFSAISGETTKETDTIYITVNKEELEPGNYTGYFLITSDNGSQNINVSMNVDDNTFTDSRDGKKYKWVKIGEQIWMAENLAYYVGAGCWAYNNDENNAVKYGRLYTWDAAKRACPSGWHLPTDAEWEQLAQYISDQKGPYNIINDYWQDVGKHLKTTSGWYKDGNGTDDFGFSALPAGTRNLNNEFRDMGYYCNWWSSAKNENDNVLLRSLSYVDNLFIRRSADNEYGYSVRCIKD